MINVSDYETFLHSNDFKSNKKCMCSSAPNANLLEQLDLFHFQAFASAQKSTSTLAAVSKAEKVLMIFN